MSQVIIMRGLPGSGKSTWITNNIQNHSRVCTPVICFADHYHIDETGTYRFNPAMLAVAHDRCLSKFLGQCKFPRPIPMNV